MVVMMSIVLVNCHCHCIVIVIVSCASRWYAQTDMFESVTVCILALLRESHMTASDPIPQDAKQIIAGLCVVRVAARCLEFCESDDLVHGGDGVRWTLS